MEGSDYNSIVYAWFEKTGIISNIRTQLRQNLVNALKGKDMTLSQVNTTPKSAKQYVYDLLIAEYLWDHNYAYTLSVFASEAPLLMNFRNNIPQSSKTKNPNDKQYKLQADYVLHALNTLGINPEDSTGKFIVSEYENNDLPLLLTILKFISHLLNPTNERINTYLHKCMQSNGTQTHTVSHDIITEKSMIIAAKKKLLRQREAYNKKLNEREKELYKRATQIKDQIINLNKKLYQAQIMMQEVNAKEVKLIEEKKKLYEMNKKTKDLNKQKLFIQKPERPVEEKDNCQIFKTSLQKIQEELEKVQEELFAQNRGKDLTIISKQEICTQTEVQEDIDTKMRRKDDEKLELKNLVHTQQIRIEELTLRSIRLSRQLEELQLVKPSIAKIIKTNVQMSKTNTILSESSSTDDIIQDAKQRLRRLEEESSKADQSYFNCITNLPL